MSLSDTITWLIFILIFRYATDIKYTRMVLNPFKYIDKQIRNRKKSPSCRHFRKFTRKTKVGRIIQDELFSPIFLSEIFTVEVHRKLFLIHLVVSLGFK